MSGALSKAALRRAGSMIRPGVSTLEIDRGFRRFNIPVSYVVPDGVINSF